MSYLFAAVLTYLVVSLFGYVVHRSLHQSWTGKLNKAHMTHHLKLYPPSDFYSDKYRDPGGDNTAHIFALAALPIVAAPFILWLCGVLSLCLTLFIVVEMLFIGWLHDYLHDAFHITNHPLTKFKLFSRWIDLHYLHHIKMQTNFGIFSFHWDRLFRTFWDK
jgi:sterol desaturase/sphingolipid hydroxylase (fatty acid hydroxylase superfamily)